MIVVLEWSSFVCTHCRGANWKYSFERAPWLVTKVMENGMLYFYKQFTKRIRLLTY